MSKPQKVDIRCILRNETATKFLKIQEAMGLENKTEVVRFLVIEYFKRCMVKQEA
jgi:hypothetical protein